MVIPKQLLLAVSLLLAHALAQDPESVDIATDPTGWYPASGPATQSHAESSLKSAAGSGTDLEEWNAGRSVDPAAIERSLSERAEPATAVDEWLSEGKPKTREAKALPRTPVKFPGRSAKNYAKQPELGSWYGAASGSAGAPPQVDHSAWDAWGDAAPARESATEASGWFGKEKSVPALAHSPTVVPQRVRTAPGAKAEGESSPESEVAEWLGRAPIRKRKSPIAERPDIAGWFDGSAAAAAKRMEKKARKASEGPVTREEVAAWFPKGGKRAVAMFEAPKRQDHSEVAVTDSHAAKHDHASKDEHASPGHTDAHAAKDAHAANHAHASKGDHASPGHTDAHAAKAAPESHDEHSKADAHATHGAQSVAKVHGEAGAKEGHADAHDAHGAQATAVDAHHGHASEGHGRGLDNHAATGTGHSAPGSHEVHGEDHAAGNGEHGKGDGHAETHSGHGAAGGHAHAHDSHGEGELHAGKESAHGGGHGSHDSHGHGKHGEAVTEYMAPRPDTAFARALDWEQGAAEVLDYAVKRNGGAGEIRCRGRLTTERIFLKPDGTVGRKVSGKEDVDALNATLALTGEEDGMPFSMETVAKLPRREAFRLLRQDQSLQGWPGNAHRSLDCIASPPRLRMASSGGEAARDTVLTRWPVYTEEMLFTYLRAVPQRAGYREEVWIQDWGPIGRLIVKPQYAAITVRSKVRIRDLETWYVTVDRNDGRRSEFWVSSQGLHPVTLATLADRTEWSLQNISRRKAPSW